MIPNAGQNVGKEEHSSIVGMIATGATTVEISVENSSKTKKNLHNNPVIPLFGIYLTDSSYCRDACTAMLVAVCFTIAMKSKPSNVVHVHNGALLRVREK